jgi:hypothetical protein
MSMIQETFFKEEVRTAQLDCAHVGDIQGAWGTIRTTPRKSACPLG